MNEQEELERYRYLQLKRKRSMASAPAEQPSIMQNAGIELRGMAKDSLPMLGALTPTNPLTIGKSAYQAVTGTPFGETDLGRDIRNIPNVPGQMLKSAYQSVRHPIKSFKERPIQTSMDVANAVGLGTAVARPIAKAISPTVTSGLEAMSGLEHKTPRVLGEAFDDSRLIVGPRKKTAQDMYRAVEDKGSIRGEIRGIPDDVALVEQAKKILDDGGTLNPDEALQARKSMDKTKKHWNETYFQDQRKRFDAIAKEKFSKPDQTYVKARKAEGLRTIFPLNKTGGASAFKMALLTGSLPVTSPFLQGVYSTGAGLGYRKILKPAMRAAPYTGAVSARSGQATREPIGRPVEYPQNANEQTANSGQPQGNYQTVGPNIKQGQEHTTPKNILGTRVSKVPTQEILLDFLRKARGDKDKARKMAIAEGFDISKRVEK